MSNDKQKAASSVGHGVSRSDMNRFMPDSKRVKGKVVSLDAEPVWGDKPQLRGQLQDPHLWRIKNVEVKILDLVKPDDLAELNSLLSRSQQEDTNVFIVEMVKEFHRATGNWKCFLKLQYVEFRQPLSESKKKKNPIEEQGHE